MQYTTKTFNWGKFKKGIYLGLFMVAIPGINNLGFSQVKKHDAEHVQRAIQLAGERDMMTGFDTLHLTASSVRRRSDRMVQFVSHYVNRSLRKEWKKNAAKISRAVNEASVRHGFDPILLLAVIQNESSFNPTVVGTSGEIGLMQIKPDTAEWVAKKNGIRWKGPSMLKDPAANIRIGAAYLAMLRSKFGFEKDLYLAAYNMGARNLNRLLSSNGYPQIYPQKTTKHYSKIYFEFVSKKNKVDALASI